MELLLNYFGFSFDVFSDVTLSNRLAAKGIKTQVIWRNDSNDYRTSIALDIPIGLMIKVDDVLVYDTISGLDNLDNATLTYIITACYYHMLSSEMFNYLFNKTLQEVDTATINTDVMFHDLVFFFNKENHPCHPLSPIKHMKHVEVWTLGPKASTPAYITQMVEAGQFGYVKHSTQGPIKRAVFCYPGENYEPKIVSLLLAKSLSLKCRYQITPFTVEAASTVNGLSLDAIIAKFTKRTSP